MRSVVGRLALGLGAFAVVAGAVAIFWGNDAAYRIPMNTDSYTRLTGQASGALAKSDTPVPVTYIVHTQVDPKRSNGDVIAMEQTSCMATTTDYCIDAGGKFVLAANDDSIVNIGHNKFALDRRTGEPVESQAKYVADAELVKPYQGVVVKFPFDTKRKDYKYWDGTLGHAVTARYRGQKTIDGLETYRFDISIPSTRAEIATNTRGTYSASQSLWVDPKTGSFIDQDARQTVALADETKLLDTAVSYTDSTVKHNVATAKSNGRSLFLIGTIARIVAPALGVVLIVVGLLLLRRRTQGAPRTERTGPMTLSEA